jgi:hypothetical protein
MARIHGTKEFQHALVDARSTSTNLDFTVHLVGPALRKLSAIVNNGHIKPTADPNGTASTTPVHVPPRPLAVPLSTVEPTLPDPVALPPLLDETPLASSQQPDF